LFAFSAWQRLEASIGDAVGAVIVRPGGTAAQLQKGILHPHCIVEARAGDPERMPKSIAPGLKK
jgi:hypothetical protein